MRNGLQKRLVWLICCVLAVPIVSPTVPASAESWSRVMYGGFGDSTNTSFMAMEVFNSYLYSGTWNDTQGSEVWRSSNGTSWSMCGTNGYGTSKNKCTTDFQEFNGYLYALTAYLGAKLYRTTGCSWQTVRDDKFGDEANGSAYCMAVFNGWLYVGTTNYTTGAQIWRYSGSTWQCVVPNGMGTNTNKWTYAMEVFNGYLYVGVGNDTYGAQIWRTSNGTSWNTVLSGGNGDSNNVTVMRMAQMGGYLYAGTVNDTQGCEVWRSYNGTSWSQVNSNGFGHRETGRVETMLVYDGTLYVGTGHDTARVWQTTNGTSWTQSNTNGFGYYSTNSSVVTLAVLNGYLYAGVGNLSNGCEVWRTPVRLFLPLVLKVQRSPSPAPTPTQTPPDVVTNGGFEQGLDGWQSGGELAVGTSPSEPRGGAYTALLGSPLYPCESPPRGEAWLSQRVEVPEEDSPELRFWYRIVTYDRNAELWDAYDYLDVLVAGQRELRAMKQEGEYGCDLPPTDLGWRFVEVDLSPWRGRETEIRFLLHMDGEYNTWVYIDDVSVW